MESLDINSLFTNMPIEQTIGIYADTFFENTERVEGLSKIELKEVISYYKKNPYSIFNGKLYNQVDGVAMGSPLGLTLVNAFLVYFQKNWLQN